MGAVRSIRRKAEREKTEDKTIRATLGQLTASHSTSPKFAGPLDVLCQQPIPIVTSLRLSRLLLAIDREIEPYQSAKKTLCERYANKDGEGKAIILDEKGERVEDVQSGTYTYDIPSKDLEEFEKEHATLTETEVTLPGEKIKGAELGNITIAPVYLKHLAWLIAD